MSFARVRLGMSRDEFLDCSPRYFDQLVKQYLARQQHDELMIAQLCAINVNFSMARPKKPVSPQDFLLTRGAGVARRKKRSRAAIARECAAALDKAFG